MPSPPLALEGSQEERAKNVSSKEMSLIEQRELAGRGVRSSRLNAYAVKTE